MPFVYTLPFDAVEDLKKVFRGVVPRDVGNPGASRLEDGDLSAACETLALAQNSSLNWQRMARVSYADGAYLELHARQAGLKKQPGEVDATLRQRIQTPPQAVTPDLILTAISQIVAPFSGDSVYIIELPRDGFAYTKDRGWSKGRRWSANGFGTVIALIPSDASAVIEAVRDALRAKVSAGKNYYVQVYQV